MEILYTINNFIMNISFYIILNLFLHNCYTILYTIFNYILYHIDMTEYTIMYAYKIYNNTHIV